MPVDYGVTWTIVSGNGTLAEANVDGRKVTALTIASGDVILRATSTFYFTGSKTITVQSTDLSNVASVAINTTSVNLEDDATPLLDAVATMNDGSKIAVVGFGDWSATFKGRIDREDADLEEDNQSPTITFDPTTSRLTYAKTYGKLEVCDQKIDVTLSVNGKSVTKEITVWGPTKVAPAIEGGDEQGMVVVEGEKIVVTPGENVTEITISHLGQKQVELPPVIDRIGGVEDASKIVIRKSYGNGQSVDLTPLMKFTAVDGGFSIALDAAASNKTVMVDGEIIPVRPALADEGDDVEPMSMDDTTVSLGVKTIPGLKYQLKKCSALGGGWSDVGAPQTAESARLQLSAERDQNPSAFYTITVSK